MGFTEAVEVVGKGIEAAGICVIVFGALFAVARYAFDLRNHSTAYVMFRRNLGRSVLLGLEFLVAGDIIRTVAIEPTFRSLGVLAGIVAIRTFLSFTLEVEITGRWPWERVARELD